MPRTLTLAVLLLITPLLAAPPAPGQEAAPVPLDRPLVIDPAISYGRLDNGLRYMIRRNRRPANRADFRLIVNAGSVLEDEDQRGLAHFVEHMAFNGTTHFPGQALVDLLESIGMRSGPEINAFTGFDETVYMIEVPTDKPEVLETAFQILEDWARGLTFVPAEVDKERGVVIEEWRLGRGAAARMQDRQFPVLLRGSRYAERLPIGDVKTIESFDHEALKRFYRDWYRPDLMAVVAVGDLDPAAVEKLVRRYFGLWRPPAEPRPRPLYEVPDHAETLFAIATDKEATGTGLSIYNKLPVREQGTAADYRQTLVEQIYEAMLNGRFFEITQKPEAPFLAASSDLGPLVRTRDVYVLGASVKEGGIERGLEALAVESERLARFGFTPTELDRQKLEFGRFLERLLAEKDNQESGTFAEEYTRHILQGEPVPGIEMEHRLARQFLPGIGLDEVNRLARERLTPTNRVVMVSAPEKGGLEVPDESRLRAVLDRVSAMEIAPYEDTAARKPLVAELPVPGKIAATTVTEDLKITEWRLANGVRVVLSPTDFKADEVLLRAFSPGGTSLVEDRDYIAAVTAAMVVPAGGLGEFSAVDLDKQLAGKAAAVRPFIGETDEGLTGSASPRDLETLFQLIYLTFTAPRCDPAIFGVLTAQLKEVLANRAASPEVAFQDTLQTTLSRNHFRARPLTVERLGELDLGRSCAFYKDRFADASDFTFVFVGNLDLEALRPLVERYLGALPSLHRKETWRDLDVDPPPGVIESVVRKGLEPKSRTAIVFSGPFRYDLRQRTVFRALGLVLESRLRGIVREELGGTYGVTVRPAYAKVPDEEYSLTIGFGSDPARMDELAGAVFREIKALRSAGPSAKEADDAREALLREHETGRKENAWLIAQLAARYQLGEDPREILTLEESFRSITPEAVREAARAYLDTDDYVRVTLYPESAPREEKQPASPGR